MVNNPENLHDTGMQAVSDVRSPKAILGDLSVTSDFVASNVGLEEKAAEFVCHAVETTALDNGDANGVRTLAEPSKIDKHSNPNPELTPEQLALVEGYLGLAFSVALQFMNRGELIDDLNQVARFGLVKSAIRFDPGRGVSFSTFATANMLGELKRHFRDFAWIVKVDRKTKELRPSVNKAQIDLVLKLGREPTLSEIANELQISEKAVEDAILANAAYWATPLDRSSLTGNSKGNVYVAIASPDDEFRLAENRLILNELLSHLTDREATVLRARFGLQPFEKPHTQQEIGEIIGSSQMHAGRITIAALSKLKDLARNMSYEDLVI